MKPEILILDLRRENRLLKETINVQHETINRLLDTYVLNRKPNSTPNYPKR